MRDIEVQAVTSFIDDTFQNCCVKKDDHKHCQLAKRLSDGCHDGDAERFANALIEGISAFASPAAISLVVFAVVQVYVFVVAGILLCRICSRSKIPYMKVAKGFKGMELGSASDIDKHTQ